MSLRAKDFQMNNLDRECDGNALRHAVPFQDLNVVGSLSSLNSSQSEINESQASVEDVVAGGQALAIIRSDAVYEEHQRAGLIPPMTPGAEPPHSNLLFCTASSDWDCTSRIVVSSQFPCETYDTIRGRRDLNPAVGTDESSVQRQGPTLDRQRVLQGVAFRCHSCSDVLECRRLRNELHDPLCKCHSTVKRRSLQPVGTRFCPPADPTAWIVDASETSSSSSPTYDRTATISPTSSDSSSIDYGFGGHLDDDDTSTPRGSISNYDHLPRRTRSDSQFTNKRSSAIVHPSSPASTAAGLTMAPSASGNVVLRPKSSSLDRTLDSLRSKVSLSKKSKGPSRLRQLLGGLHSSGDPSKELSKDLPPATVPKQVELQGSPGTSEGGAPIVQKVSSKTGMPPPVPPPRADSLGPRFSNNGHRPVVRRTPRISYVSDGDISLRNLLRPTDGALGENSGQCFNTELNDTTEPTDTHVEKRDRPRSYDFGDLNGAHRGNAGVGGASVGSLAEEGVTVSPAAGCDAGQNDRSSTASVTQLPDCSCSYSSAKLGSSWDSFTCTCSSRASFGSTRSGSSPSREGPASPLESCSSPVRCSSAAVEPPSSPDEREFDPASPTHKCSDRIHCLDSGAQVPPRGTGHRTSLYDQRANSETHRDSVAGAREVEDVDVGGDVRRVPTVMIAPVLESEVKPSVPQPPASTLAVANRIRVTIGSWKESHESYI